jgi:glucokinase
MEEILLALDFGGTKHTVAAISAEAAAEGRPIPWKAHRRVFSPAGADARYDIQTVLDLARQALEGQKPAAVGVSFGGPVDAETGIVRLSHHVPGWENIPLARMLEDHFNVPASVDNDANVAAVGEHRFGAGKGYAHLCYLTVSTGVGGGWILKGIPWRGADGMAGEIGHLTIDPNGPVCLCGKRGCVERFASGPYMAQDIRQALIENPGEGEILRSLVSGDLSAITGLTISQAAERGDSLAQKMLQRSAWALGTGIGNAANLVNPQLFVLGGGVTKSGELFWETLRTTARQTALPEVHFQVEPAILGDDAPLWGAVALAQDILSIQV